MQTIAVIIILTAALGYACWWGFQRIKNASDPCVGCDGCQLKELKEQAKKCKKQKNSCCVAKK